MTVVMKTQEMAGIDLLTDGELNRYDINHPETNGMIDYFIRPLQNVRSARLPRRGAKNSQELTHLRFRSKPAGVVEGQIGEGTLNLARDFTTAPAPSPPAPSSSPSPAPTCSAAPCSTNITNPRTDLVNALADVLAAQLRDIDAEVVQVTEENLTGNPNDGPWVADALNRIFAVVPRKSALHMCFGNYGGQAVQQGNYRQLIDFINLLHVDHVLLEMAHRGPEELSAIRDIKPDIGIGLGVIDVKSTVIESPDDSRPQHRTRRQSPRPRPPQIRPPRLRLLDAQTLRRRRQNHRPRQRPRPLPRRQPLKPGGYRRRGERHIRKTIIEPEIRAAPTPASLPRTADAPRIPHHPHIPQIPARRKHPLQRRPPGQTASPSPALPPAAETPSPPPRSADETPSHPAPHRAPAAAHDPESAGGSFAISAVGM